MRAEHGAIVTEAGAPTDAVYFPQTCVASLVNPTGKRPVEVGTIGSEGFVGLSAFLEGGAFPSRTLWQIPGEVKRMPLGDFLEGVRAHPVFERQLRRYTHALLVQVGQTVACNALHTIVQRCARWLLMTHDRVGMAPEFPLTQEFLSYMLGVRRATVTEAANALKRDGLIQYSRGHITVLNRQGLEAAACECYAVVRDHFARALHVVAS
jgi:CRP-like cAMP-binding protein